MWAVLALVVVLTLTGTAVLALSVQPSPPWPETRTPDAQAPGAPAASGEAPSDDETVAERSRSSASFAAESWWNTPLPDDAPAHSYDDRILEYLRTAPENGGGCIQLSGTGDNEWGHPIYWARPSDPSYSVEGIDGEPFPELDDVRIPLGAQPANNSDSEMSVYDLERGYVMLFTDAEYDPGSDTWSAAGATVTYLDSNGLHAATGLSDDERNQGTHRGNNGATFAVSWSEVRAGEIPHVLKVGAGPEVANRYVFPMVGSDGDYNGDDPAVPPQGLRLRIKPSVDLEAMSLDEDALVIAVALQRYGFYIGDSAGVTELKLENTVAEGRGQLWGLRERALCDLPFTAEYWDVLVEGYNPSS